MADNGRDELAALMVKHHAIGVPFYDSLADAILSSSWLAGQLKQARAAALEEAAWEVTTAEELDALPVGAVIVGFHNTDAPATACKDAQGLWAFLGEPPHVRRRSTELVPVSVPIRIVSAPPSP